MRVALATCSKLPDWEVDDRPLHDAFAARDVAVTHAVWDDPHVPWAAFDACLIRTTWDYQERRDDFLAWVDRVDSCTKLFNPRSVIRWNTHKSYLRTLDARGVPTAPTVWLPRGERVRLAAVLEERGWARAFLKPAIGSTARETMRFGRERAQLEAAQAHLDRMLATEDMLLQPYLGRVEVEGETSIIFIDGEITHAVRKRPRPGDYRVQDDFGAEDEPATPDGAMVALAEAAVDVADGDLVYARVDFLRDDEGEPRVTELELVEPSLFFRHGAHAADRLVEAVCRRIRPANDRPPPRRR